MSKQPFIDIPFGPYEPDWGGLPRAEMPGYLVDALNVRLTPNGYRGMPTFSDVTGAAAIPPAPGTPFTQAHGASFRSSTGNLHFFVVAVSNIYESRDEGDSAWQDVGPASGSGPSVGSDFVRFGDDIVLAYPGREPLVKDLTASLATRFAALAGSPPIARCAGRVRQHLVLGGVGSDPFSIRTSAIGNHEDFPTPGTADARSKQAITEPLNPDFGIISKILGGEKFGIICQERALTRMTYVGGSSVFEFDVYEQKQGTGESGNVRPVTDGKFWYFSNENGIFVTDGYSVSSISAGKLDESLYQNIMGHPDGATPKTHYNSVHDSRRGLLMFGMDSQYDVKSVIYDLKTGSFSLTNDTTHTALFDGVRNDASLIVDAGRHVYGVSGTTGFLRRLVGSPTAGAMQTGFVEIEPGHRVQIQGAHLLGSDVPGSLSISYKAAATLDDIDALQTGFTAMTAPSSGRGSFKSTARADAPFFAFRITGTPAAAQLIRGIRVYYERTTPQ